MILKNFFIIVSFSLTIEKTEEINHPFSVSFQCFFVRENVSKEISKKIQHNPFAQKLFAQLSANNLKVEFFQTNKVNPVFCKKFFAPTEFLHFLLQKRK